MTAKTGFSDVSDNEETPFSVGSATQMMICCMEKADSKYPYWCSGPGLVCGEDHLGAVTSHLLLKVAKYFTFLLPVWKRTP